MPVAPLGSFEEADFLAHEVPDVHIPAGLSCGRPASSDETGMVWYKRTSVGRKESM